VWRIDLTLWLNDPHANVTAWHESLRDTVSIDQRSAILWVKDVRHRLPSYPDRVGGLQVYNAVLDDGVRTPQWFAEWLAARGYPERRMTGVDKFEHRAYGAARVEHRAHCCAPAPAATEISLSC
jgi:hypothetical protein